MPWKETDVMNERTEFVLRALRGVEDFGELCQEYGISRKTGYKWKQRFLERGLDGLADQSRQPHKSPNQVDEDTVCQIVKLKFAHPSGDRARFGRSCRVRTGRRRFRRRARSSESWTRPAWYGTDGDARRRSRAGGSRTGSRPSGRITCGRSTSRAGGTRRTAARFEPLTIRDDFSRYVLCAQATANSRTETVREQFDRVFRKHGLPEIIRSDNGAPFAATISPLGLSRLSAWWLTLGIDLDRIQPGRPDQNGGHERMHRDMAMEVEIAAEVDWATQQASLDIWRKTFNEERPHEAIGMQVPSELYHPSPRRYEPEEVELCYPSGHFVRKVSGKDGQVPKPTSASRRPCAATTSALSQRPTTACPFGSVGCGWEKSICRLRSSTRPRPIESAAAHLGALPPDPRDLSLWAQSRICTQETILVNL